MPPHPACRLLASLATAFALVWSDLAHADLHIATWNVAWLRNAPLSDADYERCRRLTIAERARLDDRHPMRWICRRAEHYAELAAIAARVDADIIAFQEVEGVEALARILPKERYEFRVIDSPWIQRVGFAVRRSAARIERFAGYEAIATGMAERPRFGADLMVNAGGKPLRLLAVHLKSACHSRPLTDASRAGYGQPDEPPACFQLARQVKPLEDWIDGRARERIDFVVLGDFNRRFDSPVERTLPLKDSDGRMQSIWRQLDDNDPPGTRLVRLTEGHQQARACRTGDPRLSAEERAMYIDHIIVSAGLAPRVVERSLWQWPLTDGPVSKQNRAHNRELSDHCPLSARLRID